MQIKSNIRGYLFFYAFAIGGSLPYLAPYFKEYLNVSDQQVGFLLMIRPAVAILAQPLWSLVADFSGRRTHVAAFLAFIAGVSFPLILKANTLFTVIGLLALWSIFNSPLNSMGDTVAFEYLGEHRRMRFAHFRIFASLGFIIAVLSTGPVIDGFGLSRLFWVYAGSVILSAFFIRRIPSYERTPFKSGWQSLKILLGKRNVLLFLVAVVLVEISNQMGYAFLSIYGKFLGARNAHLGLIWAVATGAELFTMLFFHKIVARIGVKKILLFGILSLVFRWGPFAFAHTWWQLIPFQILHMFSLTFVYVGAAVFLDLESPSNIRFTAQAFYSTFVLNFGAIVGSLLGGIISQNWGYERLYLVCAGLGFLSTLIFCFFVHEPAGQKIE